MNSRIKKILGGFAIVTISSSLLLSTLQAIFLSTAVTENQCSLSSDELGSFIDIPGGSFIMGLTPIYPEEGPPAKILVSPFRLQIHEVTNLQFSDFVEATGYITEAELNGSSAQFTGGNTPNVSMSWWSLDAGATWRTPFGEDSDLNGRDLHPVVHVTLKDAKAYADWAGGRLPTEVEWEYAASLGLFDPSNPQSGAIAPDGSLRANIWTGFFPQLNDRRDGFSGTAPVGCYEPGLTGAYDMIGNVWEWTDSPFVPSLPRFTIKGGSFLCSEDFCQRYRVAARQNMEVDFSTSHIGFRIVQDVR